MTPNIMEVKRCLLKLGHDIRFEEIVKVIEDQEMKEYESRTQILHESVVSYGNC